MGGMNGMRQKAAILAIGDARPHEPNEHGFTWTVTDWAMEGGDFPGIDAASSLLGGWSSAELAILASVARNCGDDAALDVAAGCRAAPPDCGAGWAPGV
jgi:hypothetical protein